MKQIFGIAIFVFVFPFSVLAETSVEGLLDKVDRLYRSDSSHATMEMKIVTENWERTTVMEVWSRGMNDTLIKILSPRKDKGIKTLKLGNQMWNYFPKINKVLKVPPSMMMNSWMGSDFSNKDVSRADDIIDQYDHTLLGTSEDDGHVVNEIEAVPLEDAAVVWGKEVLLIRDDHVVLEHRFYDQDGELMKSLLSLDVGEMGGRAVALRQRMVKAEKPGEWTEIQLHTIEYDVALSDRLFTLSNLRNPRN